MNKRTHRGWTIALIALILTLACNAPAAAPQATSAPGLSAQDIAATAVAQTLTALAPGPTTAASQPPPAGQPTPTLPPPLLDTATATPCLPSAIATSNVNVRSGPGMAYDIVGNIPAGGSALVYGQNNDRTWWYIEFPSGSGQYAWVAASVTTAACIPSALQIVAAPPLPTATFTPTVVARPDLYVSEYMWSPLQPHMGVAFHIRIGIYNQGNAAAGSFTVQWWLSVSAPAPACAWNIPSMNARGGRILECDYTPAGWANYPSQVVADSANTVVESDEGNNTASATIQVRP
jgi:hypothetical protein